MNFARSQREVARALGISKDAVRRIESRAMRKLRAAGRRHPLAVISPPVGESSLAAWVRLPEAES